QVLGAQMQPRLRRDAQVAPQPSSDGATPVTDDRLSAYTLGLVRIVPPHPGVAEEAEPIVVQEFAVEHPRPAEERRVIVAQRDALLIGRERGGHTNRYAGAEHVRLGSVDAGERRDV